MPELPEVEVTRTALSRFCSNKEIISVEFSDVWKKQLLRDGSRFASFASEESTEFGIGGLVGALELQLELWVFWLGYLFYLS